MFISILWQGLHLSLVIENEGSGDTGVGSSSFLEEFILKCNLNRLIVSLVWYSQHMFVFLAIWNNSVSRLQNSNNLATVLLHNPEVCRQQRSLMPRGYLIRGILVPPSGVCFLPDRKWGLDQGSQSLVGVDQRHQHQHHWVTCQNCKVLGSSDLLTLWGWVPQSVF